MLRLKIIGEGDERETAWRVRGAAPAEREDAADAVVFLGSTPVMSDTVERLLQAGKHVLLAADRVLPAAVLDALADTARQKHVQLAVMNAHRHLPSHRLVREQLDAGKLGEVGLVRIHRWTTDGWDYGRLLPSLDLAQWLVGKPPKLAYAVGHDARYVQVQLGFPGGATALIDHAGALPAGDGYRSLSVIAAAGAAYADDRQNMQLLYRGNRPQALRADEGAQAKAALVQEFVDSLEASRDLSETLDAWRAAWKVGDAVRRSLASGQAVPPEGA